MLTPQITNDILEQWSQANPGALTDLFDRLPICYIICNNELQIEYINFGAEKTFGYHLQEVQGSSVNDVFFPGRSPAQLGNLFDRSPNGLTRQKSLELESVTKRGAVIRTRWVLVSLGEPGHRPVGTLYVIQDLTGKNSGEADSQIQPEVELRLAYDSTLEGWARALDMRDHETEHHTRRVTELADRMARAMKIGAEERMHIRRGAILHDIGKMGIPDSILHKPGPLDEQEWIIMKQHPVLALKLLSPIPYLKPALEIPYSHHERWDGGGYPRGLKGLDIPVVARMFAVVDVYDALLSERPYRRAWSRSETLKYIRDQAGRHFDPEMVEIFIANLDQDPLTLNVRRQ